ncbi:MAG: tetratricopeptide repeat protein [Acidobacteriota bacterium]
MREQSARVDLDPVERVVLVENHDEAYRVWLNAGSVNKALVHVDAHHDMWWADDASSLTIANFISAALQSGLIREIHWVVPTATWQTASGREAVARHVEKIVKQYPGERRPIRRAADSLAACVHGTPLRVCSLGSLAVIDDDVLLDIDVDFLVIPRVSYGDVDEHSVEPWCWPDELVSRLGARMVRANLATIAYSVEGGYTPLEWKYLGDELAARLGQPASPAVVLAAKLMREGAQAVNLGDIAAAERSYSRAADVWPSSAAPDFHLAHAYAGAGLLEDGRRMYRQAIAKDPSYRTPYSNAGFHRYWAGHVVDAEREFQRTLTLDAEHAGSLLGLAVVAATQKRWADAETLLRRSLAADDELVDTYRQFAVVLARRGADEEAICAYERSLALAMAGHQPLGGLLGTRDDAVRLLDADHWKTHARLARLYERKGDVKRAIVGYRICVAAGHGGIALRRRLARLCGEQETAAG